MPVNLLRKPVAVVALSTCLALGASLAFFVRPTVDVPVPGSDAPKVFSGESALSYAEAQCAIGPRPTGSQAGWKTGDYLLSMLKSLGWPGETHEFKYRDVTVRNIVAKRGAGAPVILGAHYDTRPRADLDRQSPQLPIVGGNDGASGVAVLLELARVLPGRTNRAVWLAFFDAEDRGGIDGWPFSVGADGLARSLALKPEAVVVLDMIGDVDQQIYYEATSNQLIQRAIFDEARKLGYQANFIPVTRHAITDDHSPFLALGYPAVDLIDFDYPHWHTLQDTCDKISATSLERVGRTVAAWLKSTGVID